MYTFTQFLYSVFFPGPCLRSDIVKNFYALLFKLTGQFKIKRLVVYQIYWNSAKILK